MIIGAVSGAAVAAGPLIGGFVTTYFDWRYVFAAEVLIMIGVVLCARIVTDPTPRQSVRIDLLSVALSSIGLVAVVFGMLQSKTWGWVLPLNPPTIGDVAIAPASCSSHSSSPASVFSRTWAALRSSTWACSRSRRCAVGSSCSERSTR